jgi:hypothetical protein
LPEVALPRPRPQDQARAGADSHCIDPSHIGCPAGRAKPLAANATPPRNDIGDSKIKEIHYGA